MKTLFRLPMTAVFVISFHYFFVDVLWPVVKRLSEAAGLGSVASDGLVLFYGGAYLLMAWFAWRYLVSGWVPCLPRMAAVDARTSEGSSAPDSAPGHGPAKTDDEAHDDPDTEHRRGIVCLFGDGVPQDFHAARRHFAKGAARGHAPAQISLGLMYLEGQGGDADSAAALQWLERAAEQNNAHAKFTLGNLYRLGRHVPMDLPRAVACYAESARRGYALAQTNLGLMYAAGMGVDEDQIEAFKWLSLASERGDELAEKHLVEQRAKLTATEIAEAERRIGAEALRRIRAFAAGEAPPPGNMMKGRAVPDIGPDGVPVIQFSLGVARIALPDSYRRRDTQGQPLIFESDSSPAVAISVMQPTGAVSADQREHLLDAVVPELLDNDAKKTGRSTVLPVRRESLATNGDLAWVGVDLSTDGNPRFLMVCAVVAPDARIALINVQGEGDLQEASKRLLAIPRSVCWQA